MRQTKRGAFCTAPLFVYIAFYSSSGVPAPCKGVRSRSHSPKDSISAGKIKNAAKMRTARISISHSPAMAKKRQQKQNDDIYARYAGQDDRPHPAQHGHAVAGSSTFAAHIKRSFRILQMHKYTLSLYTSTPGASNAGGESSILCRIRVHRKAISGSCRNTGRTGKPGIPGWLRRRR